MSRTFRNKGFGVITPESKGQARRILNHDGYGLSYKVQKTIRYFKKVLRKLDEYTKMELDRLFKDFPENKSIFNKSTFRSELPAILITTKFYDLGLPVKTDLFWDGVTKNGRGMPIYKTKYRYDISSFLVEEGEYVEYTMKRWRPRSFWRSPFRNKYHRNKKSRLNLDFEPDSLDLWELYSDQSYPILVDCGLIKENDFEEDPYDSYDYFASLDYFYDLMDFAGDDKDLKFKLRWKWLIVTQERWDQERNF